MIVEIIVATVLVLVILLCGFRSYRKRKERLKSYTSAGIEADVDEPPTVSRRHKRKRERRYRPSPSMEACGSVDGNFDNCDRNGRGGASASDSSGDFSPRHKTKRKKRKRRTEAEDEDVVIAKREMAKDDEEVFLADGEESV